VNKLVKSVVAVCISGSVLPAFSATLVDLGHQNISVLKPYLSAPVSLAPNNKPVSKVEELNRSVDFNHTLHVRMRQTYAGYPVWGAEGVVHVPGAKGDKQSLIAAAGNDDVSMNGRLYQNLDADLRDVSTQVFSAAQAQQALDFAIAKSRQEYGLSYQPSNAASKLMVYLDHDNKAHWAFLINFDLSSAQAGARFVKPVYILDAQSFRIYRSWNNVKTSTLEKVDGGGVGGNKKMGTLYYDGLPGHQDKFAVMRDPAAGICYLQNDDASVKDSRAENAIVKYSCAATDPQHNNVYWNTLNDAANDGYSPNNDAITAITFLKKMYKEWYNIAPITENGKSVPVTVYTHIDMDNAMWAGKVNGEWTMELGDGGEVKYPSTAIGVVAHELGHGFTEQHSNLVYDAQSGGLNESFSDMSDQAAQYYAFNGNNNWMHDAEITKAEGRALRYLDKPSKDCYGTGTPGRNCSIDDMSQYTEYTDVHYSSGIFNRVFYLIGTSPNWDARKAFNVMVQANMYYWTPNTTFAEASCGVIKAAQDYKYDVETVLKAFKMVGVDTSKC